MPLRPMSLEIEIRNQDCSEAKSPSRLEVRQGISGFMGCFFFGSRGVGVNGLRQNSKGKTESPVSCFQLNTKSSEKENWESLTSTPPGTPSSTPASGQQQR